jgi:hypothetical protein
MRRLSVVAVPLALAAVLLAPGRADAQMIIKNPGQHYTGVELEPHLLITDPPDDDFSLGLGFRATIPIVSNGFVPSINNSVGIGFGVDWFRYDACHWDWCTGHVDRFIIPVVMQWNFYLSKSWSVFGEPGLAINIWNDDCNDNGYYVDARGGRHAWGWRCPDRDTIDPFVFYAGGRYHFTDTITLTMRGGWAHYGYFSIGVSFFL